MAVVQFKSDTSNVGVKEVIKADCDQGFMKVANALSDALCKTRLSDQEHRVLQSIMRKTFGYGKSVDWICLDQISEMTGIKKPNISKTIKNLAVRKIILKDGYKLGVNTLVSEWKDKAAVIQTDNGGYPNSQQPKLSKQITNIIQIDKGVIQTDNVGYPSAQPQKKDNITKDNTTTDIGQSQAIDEPKQSPKKKTNFKNYMDIFNESLPKAKSVKVMTDARKNLIKKLIKNYEFTEERWRSYLEYINTNPEFDWMFEERQRPDGGFWQVKGIEFIASENCYAMVKESGQ